MRRKKRSKIVFLCLGIILFLICTFLLLERNRNFTYLESFFRDTSSYIRGVLVPDIDVDYSDITSGINKDMEKQIKELKGILELKEESNINLITANVISRNIDYWYHELVIDKGEKEGVFVDMAVITSDGLVGRVQKTSNHSSYIQLITNPNNMKIAVSVVHDDHEYHGILSGYDFYNETLIVYNLDKNSDVEVGDIVTTNGLGNLFPTGLYVGRIEDILIDELGLSKTLKIKSNTTFNDIRFVSVIGRSE